MTRYGQCPGGTSGRSSGRETGCAPVGRTNIHISGGVWDPTAGTSRGLAYGGHSAPWGLFYRVVLSRPCLGLGFSGWCVLEVQGTLLHGIVCSDASRWLRGLRVGPPPLLGILVLGNDTGVAGTCSPSLFPLSQDGRRWKISGLGLRV
jgi:hypothetical protein